VNRRFRVRHHRGSHRVQIDIRSASRQPGFIDDPQRLEKPFPKPSGSLVLAVRHPDDRFGEGSHEPGNVRRSPTDQRQPFLLVDQYSDVVLGRFGEVPLDPSAGKTRNQRIATYSSDH